MAKIGFVGSGNMAQAIIKGVLRAGVCDAKEILVSDVCKDKLAYMRDEFGVGTLEDNGQLADEVEVIVLCVKPQVMNQVLESMAGRVGSEHLVVSIAAGIKVDRITSVLGDVGVVRVMPNTPAIVGQGASGLYANEKAGIKKSKAFAIFEAIGQAVELEKESFIDSVTALSGSGPAYFFLLMEEMINAGQEMGLDYETSKKLTLQTAVGAAKLAMEADTNDETPGALRKKVTSPNGTTQAAIEIFQAEGFGYIVRKALEGARMRSVELSK